MKNIKDAYFAGLIDGEGSINMERNGKYFRPSLRVKMSCLMTITAIKTHYGVGRISAYKPVKSHYKQQWAWTVTSLTAVKILLRVMPYLITKRECALDVLRKSPTIKRGWEKCPPP